MYLATIRDISKTMSTSSIDSKTAFQDFLDTKLASFLTGNSQEQLTCLALIASVANFSETSKWR
jgi:hypothetical protein